jgi:hypothetical protein
MVLLMAARPRYGPLISTVGAALLAVSVFLPWYGLSFTASGIGAIQQATSSMAAQYGNASLQTLVGSMTPRFDALAGQQIASVSAHQVLKYIDVVLLVLAAIAFLSALARVAGAAEAWAGGGVTALAGVLAAACVLYRMIAPPVPSEHLVSISLRGGVWLALGSSAAIVLGCFWPARSRLPAAAPAPALQLLEELSGWTPEG